MTEEEMTEKTAEEATTSAGMKGLLITIVIVALLAFRLWAKFGNRE